MINKIKKNKEIINFIDNDQRKQFSQVKVQTDEILQQAVDKIENPDVCNEVLDRKGLALRMVLSSIPIEKLHKLLFDKDKMLQSTLKKMKTLNMGCQLDRKITPVIKSRVDIASRDILCAKTPRIKTSQSNPQFFRLRTSDNSAHDHSYANAMGSASTLQQKRAQCTYRTETK